MLMAGKLGPGSDMSRLHARKGFDPPEKYPHLLAV